MRRWRELVLLTAAAACGDANGDAAVDASISPDALVDAFEMGPRDGGGSDGGDGDLGPPIGDATGERAQAADALVDSVGVNIHAHYTDTVYAQRWSEVTLPRLRELGIRHVRDGLYTYEGIDRDSFYYERMRELVAAGIRLNLITSIDTDHGARSDLSLLEAIHEWTDGGLVTVEGANEPDIQGLEREVWVERTRELQEALWSTVQESDVLRTNVRVVAPSIVWSPDRLGDVTAWVDHGNWHPYPGGQRPEHGGLLEGWERYAAPSGDKPFFFTEHGYHNAVDGPATEGHPPTSERAVALYTPRLFLEMFRLGVARTFDYELLDLRPDAERAARESNFGLVRNDGTPKPAFEALRRLLAALADPGPTFELDRLDVSVEGSEVRQLLLQKRDGTFWLALWRPVSVWAREARAPLSVATEPTTLRFGRPRAVHVHSLDPEAAEGAVALGTESSVTIELGPAAVLIEIR